MKNDKFFHRGGFQNDSCGDLQSLIGHYKQPKSVLLKPLWANDIETAQSYGQAIFKFLQKSFIS